MQQDNLWIFRNRVGNGDALNLSAGKLDAFLAYHGFVTIRETEYLLVDYGHCTGLHDTIIDYILFRILYVVDDGVVE